MSRVTKFNEMSDDDSIVDALSDALIDISDDHEMKINITKKTLFYPAGRKGEVETAMLIQIAIDSIPESPFEYYIDYNSNTKKMILDSWDNILNLMESVKSGLHRCDIDYSEINFQFSEVFDGDDEYDQETLRILVKLRN